MNHKNEWWRNGVIYHIYPLSFYDSNGDGFGDIQGIIQKIDYLSNLGIDAIWLSPVYASPLIDFGYDVSNFREIDPVFGTLDDFKKLLQEAHARNIRVIMDMIMNHTSSLHPWFMESELSMYNNPKRNWYIWANPRNGHRPNNWKSVLGGSAWEYDSFTRQYYLHTFLKEQPDLNWRNAEMQKIFFEEIEYWLKLGVDGFRFDAINMIVKDDKFPNNPPLLGLFNSQKKWATRNQPGSFDIIKLLRNLLDKYESTVSIGEIYTLPPGNPQLAASYLGNGSDMLNMTFDFSLFFRWWSARRYFKCIENWYNSIPENGWPSIVLSNHDLSRSINRLGIGFHKKEKAKVIAVLLLTLKGTPFIYYGEELGMMNSEIPKIKLKDPIGKKFWPFYCGRDHARTPMQWNSQANGGFTTGVPWLPLNHDYTENNFEKQDADEKSIYHIYKSLINLRKEYKSLNAGEWKPLIDGRRGVVAYSRVYEAERITVFLNFTSRYKNINLNNDVLKLLFSTHIFIPETTFVRSIKLFPFQAVVLKNI
jgi:alpha-glucosidase